MRAARSRIAKETAENNIVRKTKSNGQNSSEQPSKPVIKLRRPMTKPEELTAAGGLITTLSVSHAGNQKNIAAPASSVPASSIAAKHPGNPFLTKSISAEADVDSAFVRMISPSNVVAGVLASLVPSKLIEGWRFIMGEPATPRVICDPRLHDQPDTESASDCRARHCETPKTEETALLVWMKELAADAHQFSGHPNLIWDYNTFTSERYNEIQKKKM